MDLMLLRLFQKQVEFQCKALPHANARLQAALARPPDMQTHRSTMDEIWIPVENLLNAAANIAKALWGVQSGKFAAQRTPLRASIGVTDTSPLKGMRIVVWSV